ncbi:hypothetical protein ROT00_15980 [Agromyces mediolanus]|uniref:hypothetical protein n=1 Tax=Agromyces mediolanus TaxID=41986 RepID=UPI003839456A
MEPALIGTVAGIAFGAIIAVGVVVRLIRAPRGARSRLRHAFGPIAGAGETYQELHTGQRGLQDSIIAVVQEQEQGGGAERGTDAPR